MELRYAPGSIRKNRRLGRGVGSGQGKTAGRGHKGQLARAGKKIHPSFEGGQMRLIRRLPKRGFTNPFRSTYQIVNVGDLKNWDKAVVVDVDTLKAKNMVRSVADPVKILGDGVIEHPLTVKVHAISKAAREKIEAAGGTVEVIG
ncbi:MAG: 50S ribosomal protein L15 [candidate division Zixibacteria bacterium]|nr:50S ribosomal protein L15 [candidate division Zixibacteria bacterium]